jgi:aspartyl/asparaginyl-tRNA synthetase
MKLENLQHPLDFFRHCIPPLGGLGMGLARVMLKMLD